MGMDFQYAGSASYPRFNDEIKGIVELFGGKMITNRKPQEECNLIEYFMEKPLKYEFPENLPESFKKWANDPFECKLTSEETKEIWEMLNTKREQVEEISSQILYEFDCLCKGNDEEWCIW